MGGLVRSGGFVDWVASSWDDRSGNQWRNDSKDRGMGRGLNWGLDRGFWFGELDAVYKSFELTNEY